MMMELVEPLPTNKYYHPKILTDLLKACLIIVLFTVLKKSMAMVARQP